MNNIKVGCCGFPRAKKEYSQQFKLVEIQQTFYKPPLPATAHRWRQQVPRDFEFTVKAWQMITHLPSSPTYRKAGLHITTQGQDNYGFFKPTDEVFEAWERTKDIASILEAKAVVFQCPASFTASEENIQNMSSFFTKLDRGDFVLVWEPRGEWSGSIIRALCHKLRLVHCVDPLETTAQYGELKYFRLHGGPGYKRQYSDQELARLRDISEGGAYVLFNNVTMYEDALRFKQLVESGRQFF